MVLAITTVVCVGWAADIQALTRLYPSWPRMVPWTALWLTVLSAAILLQAGTVLKSRVWGGRLLAVLVGVLAAAVLFEYATGRALGIDQLWFFNGVRGLSGTWPGRPSPQTSVSVAFLAVSVGLMRSDARLARRGWVASWAVAVVIPAVTLLAYVFNAVTLVGVTPSTGMALLTGVSLLLLGVATVLTQPQQGPIGWLLARSDRVTLVRLGVVFAGFPILLGAAWRAFVARGVGDAAALTFSAALGTGVLALVTFLLSQREWKQREIAARANARYRRSVDNAPIGMCLIHPAGGFVEVNDALCGFFGYDAETLKQKTWQELTAPDYLESDLSKADDVLAGRLDSYRMLKQYIHAKGHLIWGDLSVSCIRDSRGSVEQFIAQINDVTETVEAAARNTVLNERLTEDLRSAASYVGSIMPSGLTGPVTVSSRYLPSRELGGDCFDYTWIDDDHLIAYLIDVSGHGIEPALLAVSLQNFLRSGTLSTQTLIDPAAVLTELNRLFQMEQHDDHYFTMWYGVYDRTTQVLRYSNAGAPPAYVLRSSAPTELAAQSGPVGAFADTGFSTGCHRLPSGCQVLIYSDGASEVPLKDGRQLALEGFKKLTEKLSDEPDWSLDTLIETLRRLTPDGVFEDDVSLILLDFE